MGRSITRFQFFSVIFFLLGATQLCGQIYIPLKQQHKNIQDSLLGVDNTAFSNQEKCFYWLNMQWAMQDYDLNPQEKDLLVFKTCIDSAIRWAKTPMDMLYIELFTVDYFAVRDSFLPFPSFPQRASGILQVLWHSVHFNYRRRLNLPPQSADVKPLYAFALNESENPLLRLNIADQIATHYYYPKKKFTEALKLYQLGVDFYQKGEIQTTFWHYSIGFPGHYYIPMQTIARCLMNAALVEERMGNYPQAIKNLGQGARSYELLRDTMGSLWAYEQMAKAYLSQSDQQHALYYLNSALTLVDSGSTYIMPSKAQYYTLLFSSSYELGHFPSAGKAWFDLFQKRIPHLRKTWKTDEVDLLYTTSFWLSLQMAGIQWNWPLQNIPDLDLLMKRVNLLKLNLSLIDESQRARLQFQYSILKATQAKEKGTHYSNYQQYFSKINDATLQRFAYNQSKHYLQKLGDFEMWKIMNTSLYDFSGKTVSALQCELSLDRSLIWEKIGQPDSALWYYKHYAALRDSLTNRKNYIQLAAADLHFRTARSSEEAKLLKAQNIAGKQQLVILIIVSIASTCIAFLILTRRKRDNIIAKNNTEMLNLQIEAQVMRSALLADKNANLQQNLKESVAESIKHQSRNLDLIQSLKVAPLTLSDKASKVLQRKINAFSQKDNLNSLMEKAKETHPHLIAFLAQTEVNKNKTEMIFCLLLAMDYSGEEIGITLQKSEKAVKSMRYRIRKKLQVAEEIHLRDYLKQVKMQK